MSDFQFGSYAVVGGDLPVKNYGGSDIAAGKVVKADTSNPASGSDLPGVAVATGTTGVLGIAVETIPAGGTGRVRFLGAYPTTADGSITYGGFVEGASGGKAKALESGARAFGIALSTASDGEPVLVWMAPANNA